MKPAQGILFDVIGTTVMEKNSETIVNCFTEAFAVNGIFITKDRIQPHRGKDKMLMIDSILGQQGHNLPPSTIYLEFRKQFIKNLNEFTLAAGADEVFQQLKGKGIMIGLGSGLSKDLFNLLYDHLNLHTYSFDYTCVSEEVGRPRPYPDMILHMIDRLSLDSKSFLKVGDTLADIEEGKNAGVRTAVILTGTQSAERLIAAKPDYALQCIVEVMAIV